MNFKAVKRLWYSNLKVLFVTVVIAGAFLGNTPVRKYGKPRLEFVQKIWDSACHNAFTDLTHYRGHWYVVFREGQSHHSGDGYGNIRVIRSTDTDNWETVCKLSDRNYDLRDPKLTITPEGKLMVYYMAAKPIEGTPNPEYNLSMHSKAVSSTDGIKWTAPRRINVPDQVAWRVTWLKGKAYTVGYSYKNGCTLYRSNDGLKYKPLCKFPLKGFPNEATLQPLSNDRMMAIVRKEEKPNSFYVGISKYPFLKWNFKELPGFMGGPNTLMLPDTSILASYRYYQNSSGQLWLGGVVDQNITDILRIPSGGDCGYAGMHWFDDALWISYYSSHENKKASIYLAKVVFDQPLP